MLKRYFNRYFSFNRQWSGSGFSFGPKFKIFGQRIYLIFNKPYRPFGPWYFYLGWYKPYPWNSYGIWLGKYEEKMEHERKWSIKAGVGSSKIP